MDMEHEEALEAKIQELIKQGHGPNRIAKEADIPVALARQRYYQARPDTKFTRVAMIGFILIILGLLCAQQFSS